MVFIQCFCALPSNAQKHMRKEKITSGEYYHIYNRGINKQTIFHDRADYARFLFLILYFQSTIIFRNIFRFINDYLKWSKFFIDNKEINEVIKFRSVVVIAFCIMPNHFHIIIKQLNDGGIASYMHRVLGGYSRYYNKKYGTSGHVFQSAYRAVHIENNAQLLYLTAYIHRNPRVLSEWYKKEEQYEWSSYQDYIGISRHRGLLDLSIILEQFDSKEKYHQFVEFSLAKEISGE
jgi:putative transposase